MCGRLNSHYSFLSQGMKPPSSGFDGGGRNVAGEGKANAMTFLSGAAGRNGFSEMLIGCVRCLR